MAGITIGNTSKTRIPRLGIYVGHHHSEDYPSLVDAVLRKADLYNIGSLRLHPAPGDSLAGVGAMLDEGPPLMVWYTIPARRLDLNPLSVALHAAEAKAALGREADYWEPVNEGYTVTAFGADEGAWVEFHKRAFVEMRMLGLKTPMAVSPRIGWFHPVDELGWLPGVIDIHSYGYVPVHPTWKMSPRPSRVAWLSTGISSVNSLEGERWRVIVQPPVVMPGSQPSKLVIGLNAGRFTITINADAEKTGAYIVQTVERAASGPCVVTCQGGFWKNLQVFRVPPDFSGWASHDSADYFRFLERHEWVAETVKSNLDLEMKRRGEDIDVYEYVRRWQSGEWATERWNAPIRMPVIVGESGFPSYGICHTGLAAAMIFLGRYIKFAALGVEAVHWHGDGFTTVRDTVMGEALQWFGHVSKAMYAKALDIEGEDLSGLASDNGILLVNAGTERPVLIKGNTGPFVEKVWLMFPKADGHVKGDLTAAWLLGDVEIEDRPVEIHGDNTVEILMPNGIALLKTA